MPTTTTVTKECPICIESLNNKSFSVLKCCQQPICTKCLYSHIKSIIFEALTGGGGRMKLSCPYGCGQDLSDTTIRQTIHDIHYSLRHAIFGAFFLKMHQYLMGMVYLILSFCFGVAAVINNRRMRRRAWFRRLVCPSYRYHLKEIYTKSIEERNYLKLYERWSLTVALLKPILIPSIQEEGEEDKENNDSNKDVQLLQQYTYVSRCPRPDCECIWLSNEIFRKIKLEYEDQYKNTSILHQLFFTPYKAKEEEKIVSEGIHNDDNDNDNHYGKQKKNNETSTIEHWIITPQLGYEDEASILTSASPLKTTSDKRDGRRQICPKCQLNFCGLCSNPWETRGTMKGTLSHNRIRCRTYNRRRIHNEANSYEQVAARTNSKTCPRCTMRIYKDGGCNHITCCCGHEWCYVCKSDWNGQHYNCRREPPTSHMCVVS